MNSGPGWLVVNAGSTRQSTASVDTVASAVAVPSALNVATCWRTAPIITDSPRMPLVVIIAAANTVSRASVSLPLLSPTISVTISPTSITVTATASTREPNGSPTRCATTSAKWTADSTEVARKTPTMIRTSVGGFDPHVRASTMSAATVVAFRKFIP